MYFIHMKHVIFPAARSLSSTCSKNMTEIEIVANSLSTCFSENTLNTHSEALCRQSLSLDNARMVKPELLMDMVHKKECESALEKVRFVLQRGEPFSRLEEFALNFGNSSIDGFLRSIEASKENDIIAMLAYLGIQASVKTDKYSLPHHYEVESLKRVCTFTNEAFITPELYRDFVAHLIELKAQKIRFYLIVELWENPDAKSYYLGLRYRLRYYVHFDLQQHGLVSLGKVKPGDQD